MYKFILHYKKDISEHNVKLNRAITIVVEDLTKKI